MQKSIDKLKTGRSPVSGAGGCSHAVFSIILNETIILLTHPGCTGPVEECLMTLYTAISYVSSQNPNKSE